MNVCKTPCNDCPFRKSSAPGWLGPYQKPEDLHRLVMSENPFPCHLSHQEDVAFEFVGQKGLPYCKGAILYMKKSCKWPRSPDLANAVRSCNPNDLDDILSISQFLSHHAK